MKRRPSSKHKLRRVDIYGNYTKSNCVWATRQEQQNNRRKGTRVSKSKQSATRLEEYTERNQVHNNMRIAPASRAPEVASHRSPAGERAPCTSSNAARGPRSSNEPWAPVYLPSPHPSGTWDELRIPPCSTPSSSSAPRGAGRGDGGATRRPVRTRLYTVTSFFLAEG